MALRGARKGESQRSKGGAENGTKAAGLGHALLQYFVDVVQRLQCRADTSLLMTKARELRALLENDKSGKWCANNLPKLIGNAGAKWFERWRRRNGIGYKVTGMKLKVAWRKIKNRVRVWLSNVFRLRAWWDICHDGKPMRWISLDQKPSWWNNAGLTKSWATRGRRAPTIKENFAHTRSRFTILTVVEHGWKTSEHEDNVPKCAILFKGKPFGKIWRRLQSYPVKKPWMKIQVQEEGSYRSGDMVEALDWVLPTAHSLEESTIVMLDWFSGHLTDEVAELIRSNGHVLIFHGGGTTPFTQINDTHLHARLAQTILTFENWQAEKTRKTLLARGINKMPSVKHEDLVHLVQCSWAAIDHAKVSEKGHRQTGPTMPMTGPVKPEEVFRDLLDVLNAIDPDSTPTEVSLKTVREDAIAFVRKGQEEGRWTNWNDVHAMIEPHDDEDDGLAEGLEAFAEVPDYDDEHREEEPDADEDDKEAEPGAPDKDDDGDSEDDASQSTSGDDEADDDDAPDHGHDGAGAQPSTLAHSLVDTGAQPSNEVLEAYQLLYNKAAVEKDDASLRFYRNKMVAAVRHQKLSSDPGSVVLRKRAQELFEENEREAKRYKEEQRLDALKKKDNKTAEDYADAAKVEARTKHLQQTIVNKQFVEEQRQAKIRVKRHRNWLQTRYPAELADRCIQMYTKSMSPKIKHAFRMLVNRHLHSGSFKRHLFIDNLWEWDKNLTTHWGSTKAFHDKGPVRNVHCGLHFAAIIDSYAPQELGTADVRDVLSRLLDQCVPFSDKIFLGNYGVMKLLHINDYIIEKTFVYAIFCLSKWLGHTHFNWGIGLKWPPSPPPELLDPDADVLYVPTPDEIAPAEVST